MSIEAMKQEPWPEEPEGHIAGGVQPSKQTQVRWTERWYGSLAEKGWWICCGREHIAHLGTEVSSDEVRKIVDAHNRTSPPAQQQEPVAWMHPDGRIWTFGRGLDKSTFTVPLYTASPAAQPAPVQEPLVFRANGNERQVWKTNGTVEFKDAHGNVTMTLTPEDIEAPVRMYPAPPAAQRKWVGLTQQDIDVAFDDTQEGGGFNEFAHAIEQRLKEKNT